MTKLVSLKDNMAVDGGYSGASLADVFDNQVPSEWSYARKLVTA